MMAKHSFSVPMRLTATVLSLAILSTPLLPQAAEIRFLQAQEESHALGSDQQADKIYKIDGTILEGKVLKITETTIEFDPIGDIPYIPIPRLEVQKIVYSDGREVDIREIIPGEHRSQPEKEVPVAEEEKVIISDTIGEELDRVERDHYKLFMSIKGFQSAAFFKGEEGYIARIKYLEHGVEKTRIWPLTDEEFQKIREQIEKISESEEEAYLQICAQAEADAKQDEGSATKYWIGGFCCGGLVFASAATSSAKPPAARLIGKSDKYIFIYTLCYEKEVKSIRTKAAYSGWAACTGLAIAFYIAYIFALLGEAD